MLLGARDACRLRYTSRCGPMSNSAAAEGEGLPKMFKVAKRIRGQTSRALRAGGSAGWEERAEPDAKQSGLGLMSCIKPCRVRFLGDIRQVRSTRASRVQGGWQLPKPTNGERNVFSRIGLEEMLLRSPPTRRGSNLPVVRRSRAPLTSKPCRNQHQG